MSGAGKCIGKFVVRDVPGEVDLIELESLLDALTVAHDSRRQFNALNYTEDNPLTIRRREALRNAYEVAKERILTGARTDAALDTLRRLIDAARAGILEGARYSDPD